MRAAPRHTFKSSYSLGNQGKNDASVMSSDAYGGKFWFGHGYPSPRDLRIALRSYTVYNMNMLLGLLSGPARPSRSPARMDGRSRESGTETMHRPRPRPSFRHRRVVRRAGHLPVAFSLWLTRIGMRSCKEDAAAQARTLTREIPHAPCHVGALAHLPHLA